MTVVVQGQAPLAHRPEVGGEPQRRDDPLAGHDARVLALDRDLGLLERSPPSRPVTWALTIISTPEARTWSTLALCARNASRRCTRVTLAASGSSISAQSRALSPPPTTTTSRADVLLAARDEVLQPAAEELLAGRERAGRERADAAGDDEGAAGDLDARRWWSTCSRPSSSGAELLGLLARGGRSAVRGGLGGEAADQVAPGDRREAGDVVDLLLGVHRGDLAADLGQRVDHGDGQAADAGVVGAVEPDRPGPDDEDVDLDLGCH